MPGQLQAKRVSATMPPQWEGFPEAKEFSTIADLERYLESAVDGFMLLTQQRVLRNARAVMRHLDIAEPLSHWPDPIDRATANRMLRELIDALRQHPSDHDASNPRHPR